MHPILAKIGPITIYSYGFCAAIAILLSAFWLRILGRKRAIFSSSIMDFLFAIILSGLIGARLFYVAQHWSDYADRLQAVFFIQEGGFVWYGGFLGALLVGWIISRQSGSSFLFWADLFAPVLPLAHAIGRVGCFLNGCCIGKDGRPVQLYESASLVALSLLLHFYFFARKATGFVFGVYLLGYGLIRFGLEFLRAGQEIYYFLTIPQWISIGLILWGSVVLFGASKNVRQNRAER